MHSLSAVVLAGPGRSVPSIAELAETPGMATPVIVAPGASTDSEIVRRVGEHLHLGAVVLLLFHDSAEATAFETKLAEARVRARRCGGRVPEVQVRGAPRRARPVQLLGA
jgi:hypothetical protein